jgi:hypothetical protein
VQHGRVDGVRLDQRAALARRQAGGGGEVVDRPGDALGVDRQRGLEVGR